MPEETPGVNGKSSDQRICSISLGFRFGRPEEPDVSESPNLMHQLHNDSGNPERLIAMYVTDLWYCHAFHKWLVFDAFRWCVEDTERATHLAKQAMLEFLRQAIEAKDELAEKFARGSLDARRIRSLLYMAECELPIRPTQLGTDPYSLNFLNGTVDLRTGELRAHDRADLITKLIPYKYRPNARVRAGSVFSMK
jgi:putative DNA primase/helicase